MWLHAEVVTVDDIPRYWARRTPQATALIDRLGKTTYAELDRSSDRVASAIVAAGIRPPANIGFLGKNSSRYFELLFGVTKAGCAIAPLNWRLAVPELVAIIEDADCPLIFVGSRVRRDPPCGGRGVSASVPDRGLRFRVGAAERS